MPRGSGLYQQLMEKRRTFEKAIAEIDAVVRIVRTGKVAGGTKVRRPMSAEQKAKISASAKRRHAQVAKGRPHQGAKPKVAINRPRPKEQGQDRQAAAASA